MKALVLCAGRGTRLGPLTSDRPKAILPIAGRPLVLCILDWLAAEGVGDVLINLHYLPNMIPEVVAHGGNLEVRVRYTREPVLLGTAGTVRANQDWFDAQDVLVVYGDVLTDQPLRPLLHQHRDRNADASLVVHRRAGSNSVITMKDDGRITSFTERPRPEDPPVSDSWVFSGIQLLTPRLIARIPERVPADLPRDVYEPLARDLSLYGFALSGQRVAVDSLERLEEASRLFGSA